MLVNNYILECNDVTFGFNCSQFLTGKYHNKIQMPENNYILECSDGTFGFNCNMACGMCYNNETCDRKSGVCPTGCDVGYKTENCDEGK